MGAASCSVSTGVGASSATRKVETGKLKCACRIGLNPPPRGVFENMSDSGYISQYGFRIAWSILTARTSRRLACRTVLGVFPRSFPGVLKNSTTFLQAKGQHSAAERPLDLHRILVKYLYHMLIQPFNLISRRKGESLCFFLCDTQSWVSFICYPCSWSNRQTWNCSQWSHGSQIKTRRVLLRVMLQYFVELQIIDHKIMLIWVAS